MSTKEIPFSVNRNDARPLFNQVVDGFREAIISGYYVSGDKIPSSRELCPILGVSRIVTQAALEQLAAEGLVVSRPRVGTVVRDRNEKQWRGHVVFVYEKGDDNYLKTMLASSMQDRLTEEGWLFSQASVGAKAGGGCDFTHLDVALSRSVDLVVVMFHRPKIYAYLAKRRVPYAVFGEKSEKPASAVGSIHFDYNMANGDFAAVCKAAGVQEVVEIYWHKLMCDVTPALKKAGIRVKKMKVPVDESEGRLIGVKRAGRLAFEKMIADGSVAALGDRKGCDEAHLSQVFFIADDYLASGALLALSYAGLKVPEDVRLATFANAGLGPDYRRPLSRMEMDPFAVGEKVAATIIKYFKTGEFPAKITVGSKWIAGETITA
ncbi:MAG: GntR family transcriptional regulator [Kiritimatiellae bacterium]|nr:GntR family transcriptional regulator [Kiritimatiellia bacterium]MBQ6330816.1 GntR family transcriptional regulator [Kiritimatiellia bacterium]